MFHVSRCQADCSETLGESCVYSVTGNVLNLQLAGERCGKTFAEGSKDEELKLMLDWAFEGFLPTGPEGFVPPGTCTFINIYLIFL